MIFFAVAMLPGLNRLVVAVLVVANRAPETVFRDIDLGLVLAFAVKGRDSKYGIGAGVAIRRLQVVVAVVMTLFEMADRRICFPRI